ncbi:TPA: restriction endonuclease subunit S [Vibrio diabolicus]
MLIFWVSQWLRFRGKRMTDTMITQMPKYELMQDSGFEWIGDIPSSWNLLSVKQIYRLVMEESGKNHNLELLSVYSDIGVRPRAELEEKGNKASSTDGYWLVRKGDFVVNKLLAWMGGLGLSEYDGVTSPAYDVLRPRKEICGSYFNYLFRSPACTSELKKHSRGIMDMRLRLYFDKFGVVKVPFPSLKEQKAISNFLDKRTSQIDEAIAIKQKQIELLKERKQIIIQQVVTHGLNPDVPMKDSGVDWIGTIPEHWDIAKLKLLTDKIVDGAHFTPTYVASGVPFLRVTDLTNMRSGLINWGQVRYIPEKEHKELIKRAKANVGDVLLSKNGTIGLTKVIDWEEEFSFFVSLCLIKVKKNLSPYYFEAFFNSPIVDRQITFGSSRTSVTNLHLEKIKELLIVLPPIEEQAMIVDYIKSFSTDYDEAINIQTQQIEKLKEYKATLINSAVTGKIKVTELA